jgi:hypothetical protein
MATDNMVMSSRERYLQSIRDATDKLGRPPTYDEYDKMAGPCTSTIENNFGSWTAAKREAGVSTERKGGKPAVNESYFSKIDSTEKAYWLGIMYADGSVFRKNGELSQVFLGLKDREHVIAFRDALDAEYRVRSREDGGNELTVTSQKMANDLLELGCDTDKTFSSNLPNLDREDLRAAFVRGMFDGDGSLKKAGGFSLCGMSSERFRKILSWLPSDGYVSEDSKGRHYLYVRQKHGVEELWNWLYPNGVRTRPALSRKMQHNQFVTDEQ